MVGQQQNRTEDEHLSLSSSDERGKTKGFAWRRTDGRTDGRRWGTAGLVGYLLGPGPFGILISSASAYRLPLVDSPAITGTTPSPFAIIGGTAPPSGALPSGAVCPHFVWALLAVDLWAMATVFSRLQRCTCCSYYLCRRFSFFPFFFWEHVDYAQESYVILECFR